MTSIRTNASAMTALKSLTMTNKSMDETQNRISTGYRVAEASDNAAYWSIATTMRSDSKSLSTVQDALGLGAAKLDVTYTAVNAVIKVVDDIKSKLVAAREAGVDKTKIQAEITQLQGQLQASAKGASFSGENWLYVNSDDAGFNTQKSIVSSFTRNADGTVEVGTITLDMAGVALFDEGANTDGSVLATGNAGLLDAIYDNGTGERLVDQTDATLGFSVSTIDISALTNNSADTDLLNNYIKGVDNALQRVTKAASDLGAAKNRVALQKDFISTLMDAIEMGVGQLVDADMNKESTKLQALQTQQQLGIQALSIANSNSQNIMKLFQG